MFLIFFLLWVIISRTCIGCYFLSLKLSILQIRQALEVRLVSAEEEIKEAESEKLNKEESALRILAHEESNMEKVVQESKILEQQAEENSKVVNSQDEMF